MNTQCNTYLVETEDKNSIVALIPAAGIGRRMKAQCSKQYLPLAGKTLIEHTVAVLLAQPRIQCIVIVLHPTDTTFLQLPIASDPRIHLVTGGDERADSVLAGLHYLSKNSINEHCWVLVHDAARPCLHDDDLDRLLQLAQYPTSQGGILAVPVRDTMKRSYKQKQIISHTVERQDLWHALTPQFCPLPLLYACLQKALADKAVITDEASALEYCGYQPQLVIGRTDNIKVTTPEDLALADFYLSRLKQGSMQ